jgi:hypothetical protein
MDLFFSGWPELWRTGILGFLSYASLVLFLRISGKRTLSKMNAFDLVVTVALGSTLATILLNKQVALAEGLLALLLLIGLQFCVTWGAVRSSRLESLVKNEPALLLHQGEFLRRPMLQERVTNLKFVRQCVAEASPISKRGCLSSSKPTAHSASLFIGREISRATAPKRHNESRLAATPL